MGSGRTVGAHTEHQSMETSVMNNYRRLAILSVCLAMLEHLPAAYSLCDTHHSSGQQLKISWDESRQECTPALCNGAKLPNIPDASGHLPAGLACKLRLYDSEAARVCLAGKYVVSLGDSTMTESVYDIIMLMTGLAANLTELNAFVRNATRQFFPHSQIWVPIDGLPYPHGIQVDFHGNQRNMTVTAGTLGLYWRHRFVGHVQLTQNMLGTDTFFHPDFQEELTCLTQPGVGCAPKVPDILIVNSGLHDANMPIPRFANNMRALAKRLRAISDLGTKVVWRGNNVMPETHGMDVVSRHYIEAEGLPYVDTRAIMEYFTGDLATGCCSDLHMSGGQHIGAISKFHNESSRLTVSSMVTQGILGSLCTAKLGSATLRPI